MSGEQGQGMVPRQSYDGQANHFECLGGVVSHRSR